MELKKFNMIASVAAFFLGTIYVFSDKAGITANVIGASGSGAGFTSIMGVVMIMGAIGLFIVSMHNTENHSIDLERLVRKTKDHREIQNTPEQDEEYKTDINNR